MGHAPRGGLGQSGESRDKIGSLGMAEQVVGYFSYHQNKRLRVFEFCPLLDRFYTPHPVLKHLAKWDRSPHFTDRETKAQRLSDQLTQLVNNRATS